MTFTESATDYGLDFTDYSTHAAVLDYDLDGDLDMYLLNHSNQFKNINDPSYESLMGVQLIWIDC